MSISLETKNRLVELAMETSGNGQFFNEVEFKKDVYNIFIIKKMINRFLRSGEINEKLVINNIIITLNTFGINRSNHMFRLITNDLEFSVIKAFLLFLDAFVLFDEEVQSNEIITGILVDVAHRYRLEYRT